ncbi:MAG: DUF99 family protein [Gammaproteobacteria bacterium]|nr:DUF99 family protein [Gammaproteobacteria bacterium]MCI0590376.1 DUF99 family protein [Gammaproteobacteria bacterium]
MNQQTISHVVGFDDAPFPPNHRGDVRVVGAVYSGVRLEGVLSGKVRRDGVNATRMLIELVAQSRFFPQLQAIMIQGIAFAGFNVVDIKRLNKELQIPVMAIVRKAPNMEIIEKVLLNNVPGGRAKWARIKRGGPVERAAGVYVQRAGISHDEARELIWHLAVNGTIPEPLRTAHLIAGGIEMGESRHRV